MNVELTVLKVQQVIARREQVIIFLPLLYIEGKNRVSAEPMVSAMYFLHIVICSAGIARITRSPGILV